MTFTNFMRPEAPALMVIAALWQANFSATNAMSSSFALPSTGGALSLASQVPSAICVSSDALARGFTLICSMDSTSRPTSQSEHKVSVTLGNRVQRSALPCISSDVEPCNQQGVSSKLNVSRINSPTKSFKMLMRIYIICIIVTSR